MGGLNFKSAMQCRAASVDFGARSSLPRLFFFKFGCASLHGQDENKSQIEIKNQKKSSN